MPIYGLDWSREYGTHVWRRQAAWRTHYMRKGCSQWKASDLARKKVARRSTWPPVSPSA
jgi:hypothetical protein